MADKPNQNWYPTADHPRQDTDRIIFDNLYKLRDQQTQASTPAKPTQQGLSGTVVFPAPGFAMGKSTYHSLTFSNGLLVSVS